MDYKKYNNYLGWLVFIIATTVYFITLEDSVSLWDCGEYITAAYKLEVGHPPGAPLFMVLGRLSSFFADPTEVAVWINRLSAVSSSATILFMFWSITLLVKKIALRDKKELTPGDKVAILGAGLVGSLAYAFSDSFWFSAVEGEVYAMSSLFTAMIFWAILKWDEEMMEIKFGQLSPKGFSPDRWLLFIMFMLGLAIGVHLLGILVVPAIAFVIYFRYGDTVNMKGIFVVGVLALVVLVFIQEGVIPGSIALASSFEINFVTSLGLPFYSGTIFFFAMLIGLFLFLLRYSKRKNNRVLYSSVMGLVLLMIGYGSFAVIVIRSNANTPLDENDPENLVTFHSYLKRDQYGKAPLVSGNYWNSKENGGKYEVRGDKKVWSASENTELWDDQSPILLRRFVVSKGDAAIKAFKDEKTAMKYSATVKGSTVEETYFETNEDSRKNRLPTYAQTTIFPRMYWTQKGDGRIQSYKEWSGYDANDEIADAIREEATEMGIEYSDHPLVGNDQMRLPTASENLTFFAKYQMNWMYFRYFFWNFSGRQNDIQGSRGGAMRGNWISGFSVVDDARLGDQANAPYFTTENPANNKFFFLPLILGLIGLFFHFYRTPKDAFVVFLAFLFTGIAIVVYLNQKTLEPRERDYAYAGSFYFFTMWIGIGVYALYDAFKSFGQVEFKKMGIIGVAGLVFFGMLDIGNDTISMPSTISWIIVCLIGGLLIAAMVGLRKVLSENKQGAMVAIGLTLFVPLIMAVQGWDDHDRSLKTSAHDLAYNYLSSCEKGKNAILFTNGDNDTFPLWYMQEVEGKFTDVRVCNLSLMQTDWYTNQMKMKAYDSKALPIKFREDQILMNAGKTEQVVFSDAFNLTYIGASSSVMKEIFAMRAKVHPEEAKNALMNLSANAPIFLASAKAKDPSYSDRLRKLIAMIGKPSVGKVHDDAYNKMKSACEIFKGLQEGRIILDEGSFNKFRSLVLSFENGWDETYLADAMAFVRNDDNIVGFNEGQTPYRVFPSTGFVLPVNKENLVKSGLIKASEKDQCLDEIRFVFTEAGLTKEQVMMLDVLANNDWLRPIYFSSPHASKVGKALFYGTDKTRKDPSAGYVKQSGMAFELTPLKMRSSMLHREKMYNNLMYKYHYGQMNNPDVLTDYYTRRHTVQYRNHFLRLSRDYMTDLYDSERFEQYVSQDPQLAQYILTDAEKASHKKKIIALVKKSLKVMPAEFIIDYGEPTVGGALRERLNGQEMPSYNDGVLHEYVSLLLYAGDTKAANKLGLVVCDQLESVFNYFDKTNVRISTSQHNIKDFYSALEAYLIMYKAVMDPETGDRNGVLAQRVMKNLANVYKTIVPSITSRIDEWANEEGESTIRESDAGEIGIRKFQIQNQVRAVGLTHQYIAKPKPATQGLETKVDSTPLTPPVGDSVLN